VFRTGNSNSGICQRDRDTVLEQLETSLKRKSWERAQRLQEKTANQIAATRRRVGVDHILQRQKQAQKQAQQLASNAFKGDSDQLLEQAGELLQVIRKSKALLDRMGEGSNSSGNAGTADDVEAAERLAGLLSDMGMTSALTKSQIIGGSGHASGIGFRRGGSNASDGTGCDSYNNMTPSQRQYYELTARQLADFLVPRLKGETGGRTSTTYSSSISSSNEYGRGIMSLTDAYCLFNRARGTNLISPEDLRHACSLLSELNVGLTQRTFPSGVIVVQLDDMALDASNPEGAKRLVGLCQPATTALEASHHLNISPLLAMEQLEEAERLGVLCRDVTLETVRFYPNKFVDFTPGNI
jgi:ESCRT-II complex subunit VPS36